MLLTEIGPMPSSVPKMNRISRNKCLFSSFNKNFQSTSILIKINKETPLLLLKRVIGCHYFLLCLLTFSWMISKVKISYSKCSFGIFITPCLNEQHPVSSPSIMASLSVMASTMARLLAWLNNNLFLYIWQFLGRGQGSWWDMHFRTFKKCVFHSWKTYQFYLFFLMQ